MFPFNNIGSIDPTEKKALLFAFLVSALFIALLRVSAPPKRTRKLPLTTLSTTPLTKPVQPLRRSYVDPLEKFRVVPANFKQIDFKNFSYGSYIDSNGKRINLTLTEEGPLVENYSGWFTLRDVYYKDLTGDGVAEAIVRILHVSCGGGSCDGGADLFYIYTRRNGKLKNLWRYETGSYAYGCGLKSFTFGNKQMVLELFGRCSKLKMKDPGPAKFMVSDLTFIFFKFNGRRFLTKTVEYITEPSRNVKNWEPEIRIY